MWRRGSRTSYGEQPAVGISWKIRLLPVFLFALYGFYYYVSNQEPVPITGRSHLVDISRQEEVQMGLESYQEILRQSHVLQNGRVVDLVRTILAVLPAREVAARMAGTRVIC